LPILSFSPDGFSCCRVGTVALQCCYDAISATGDARDDDLHLGLQMTLSASRHIGGFFNAPVIEPACAAHQPAGHGLSSL
jgi:hypothetical protein